MDSPLFIANDDDIIMSEPRSPESTAHQSDEEFIDDDDANTTPMNPRKRRIIIDSDDEIGIRPAPSRTPSRAPSASGPSIPDRQPSWQPNSNDTPEIPDIPQTKADEFDILADNTDDDVYQREILDSIPEDKDGNPKLKKNGEPVMRKKKQVFDFNRRYVFLTYPKCNLTVEEFDTLIREFDHRLERFYAVREFHKDGTPHFHVIGDLGLGPNKKPPHIRRADAFNIGGKKHGLNLTAGHAKATGNKMAHSRYDMLLSWLQSTSTVTRGRRVVGLRRDTAYPVQWHDI
ncbi:hypothetical protein FN846DRAFT_588743 [Sphaerosporella brunnea]|uniref:CRESS-DNA virus Rep endonuclease domain-containing protein n=1 Tax=Sphaerosporella brunnea TaxID=1250544 RepID=A0A5J5EBS9_9PEZI|nr:hypothetical protein FN846DRAFT_588743 [Sphaerosporella brunnea]